jgi:hypothetical protein
MRANELSGCGNDFMCVWPVAGTGRKAAQPKERPDYSSLSDKEWIARVQEGDEEAAGAMIERPLLSGAEVCSIASAATSG